MPNTQQIGKAGEPLLQYRLLVQGIESAPMTTDAGIDLVVYSPRAQSSITVQVKTNLKPKPGGGKGSPALDWWIPEDCPADLVALIDLSGERVWIFRLREIRTLAQQHPKGRYHLYAYVDPKSLPAKSSRPRADFQFEPYRLENRLRELF